MVFLVLSSFFYAFNNLLWKRLLSKFDLWLIIGFRCLLTSCIGLAIIFLFYPTIFSALTYAVSIKIIVASIFGAFGLISMILALKEGSLTQLGVFNLLIVFLVSLYLFFFENIFLKNYAVASIFIIVGFTLYIFQIKKIEGVKKKISFRNIILFTMMSFFFAASSLMHWYNLKQEFPAILSVTVQELVVFFVVLIIFNFKTSLSFHQIYPQIQKIVKPVVFMAIIIFSAIWTGFLGLQYTNPLISSLISLITPILTIIFGVLFFKDQWNSITLLSLFLISIGVYLINLEYL
ncbi:DMT family transporter [Flavobacteriaceae bacterium]|nr:DMT family transporter [Flavobacteriaceae bacterium]